jgi:hypothetical protein
MKPHIGAGETYGVMAEFDSPQTLVHAADAAREAGYTVMDAYTPFPVEGLAEAVGFHDNKVPMIVLTGGVIGGLAGFGMQYFAQVLHYPLIIGGKPLNAWPAYIPITFELTVLFASLTAVFGMLALNGLPMPYHPVFNTPRFAMASRDRFFLCIESRDPKFEIARTREFLQGLHPVEVNDVPW